MPRASRGRQRKRNARIGGRGPKEASPIACMQGTPYRPPAVSLLFASVAFRLIERHEAPRIEDRQEPLKAEAHAFTPTHTHNKRV